MKDILKIGLGIVIGFGCIGAICLGLLLTGAITCGLTALFPEEVVVVEESILEFYPTATVPAEEILSLGKSVTVDGVEVAVKNYEIVGSYEDKFEWQGQPKEGAKFLWLYVEAQNVGQVQECLPSAMDFRLWYKDDEIYKRMASPVDRETYHVGFFGEGCVYPGVGREGWLLYEIPMGAEPADILVRFSHPVDKPRPMPPHQVSEYYWWRLE